MSNERMNRETIVGLLNAAEESGVEPSMVMANGYILVGLVLGVDDRGEAAVVYLDGFARPVPLADIVRVEGVDIGEAGPHLYAARSESEAKLDPSKMAPVVIRFTFGGDSFRAVWVPPKSGVHRGKMSMEMLEGHDALGCERWSHASNIGITMVESMLRSAGVIPEVKS